MYLDNEIQNIGFRNLIEDNELIKQYTPFISADTKVHYFGSYYKRTDSERTPSKKPDCSDGEVKVKFYDTTQCTDVKFYGEDKEKIDMCFHHMDYLMNIKPEKVAVLEMRSHIAWYLKGMNGSQEVKNAIFRATNREDIEKILNNYLKKLENSI